MHVGCVKCGMCDGAHVFWGPPSALVYLCLAHICECDFCLMHNKLHCARERVRTPRHITCGNIFAYLMMIITFSLLACLAAWCLLRSQVNSNRCMFVRKKDLAKIPTNQPPISSHRSGKSSIAILLWMSIAPLIEPSVFTNESSSQRGEKRRANDNTRDFIHRVYAMHIIRGMVHVCVQCAPHYRPNWLWLYVHSTRAFVLFYIIRPLVVVARCCVNR